MSDAQRLDEIRALAQNVIDGWRESMPRDVYFALERIVRLSSAPAQHLTPIIATIEARLNA